MLIHDPEVDRIHQLKPFSGWICIEGAVIPCMIHEIHGSDVEGGTDRLARGHTFPLIDKIPYDAVARCHKYRLQCISPKIPAQGISQQDFFLLKGEDMRIANKEFPLIDQLV